MKTHSYPLLAALLLCIASSFPMEVRGAISLGVIEQFDTVPTNTSWATRSIPGSGSDVFTEAQLDELAQTNNAAEITGALITSASTAPSVSGAAGWSSAGRFIYTRPGGVAAQCLMATIENTSAAALGFVTVRYRVGLPLSSLGETPDPVGQRVFFSLTGEPGSWEFVPGLTSALLPPSDGYVCANLELGDWLPGARLYLLWIDDNGGPGVDGLYTIDDFTVTPSIGNLCPPLVIQPQPSWVTNLVGRTFQLAAPAVGVDLTYQWHKEGLGPIPLAGNFTANRATLVVTNAQMTDSGNYFAVVSSAGGSVTSLVARVDILHDDIPPRILGARLMPDGTAGVTTAFHILFDEAICASPLVCQGDAMEPFNWWVEDLDEPGEFNLWPMPGYFIGETNLVLPIDLGGRSPRAYRLHYVGESQITDMSGFPLAAGTTVTVNPTIILSSGDTNYAGIEDAELESASEGGGPGVPHGNFSSILVDLLNGTGLSQGLIQFKNLFGYGPAQVPPDATIRRATLRLRVTDSGSSVAFHRMLVPWSESTATWNSFGSGVQSGVHAYSTPDAMLSTSGRVVPFTAEVDVLASMVEWRTRFENHGWELMPTGTDGVRFDSSETGSGPVLVVEFQPNFQNDLPQSIGLLEGQTATLAPQVFGYPLLLLQWLRDGVPLIGRTNATLVVASADVCAGPARFQLRAACPAGSLAVTSAPITVSVQADIVRPVLLSVNGTLDGTTLTLRFSKVLNPTNATNTANYTFMPPLTVGGATLVSNGTTVVLSTPPRGLVSYSLRIAGVTDDRVCQGGFPIDPNPTVVPITGVQAILPWASEWFYATNSQDSTLATVPWFAPGFVAGSDWRTGMALLGHETSAATVALFPTALRTFIPPNTNTPPDFITTYYRREIELPPLPPGAIYALGHFIDDGAVFYLDGTEFARVNLPTNAPVLSSTRAVVAGEASAQYLELRAAPGRHLLAVELHQGGATTSADNLFGAQILAVTAPPEIEDAAAMMRGTRWFADSSWQMISSTNVAGPYLPWTNAPPTNEARFFQLRFRGVP